MSKHGRVKQLGLINLGARRLFHSTPTMDTERESSYRVSREWTPERIEIFGHQLTVDIPTGNLVISTTEVAYPYYNLDFGINRKYDVQEQHMQLLYLRNYPNTDPKPHWFGNWQFAHEADVDEVWHNTYPELHVTSGVATNELFEIEHPDFRRNLKDSTLTEKSLRTYGIPGRMLDELGWKFAEDDFLLRTLRGSFRILSGHFQEETLVDDIDAKMWIFDPISGSAFRITSEFFYNIPGDKYRDVGYPLIVTNLTDALGHTIELKPSDTSPPFREYVLSDGSGRGFHIELDEQLTYLDGLNPNREVRKYLVSKVIDGTKTTHNLFNYRYSDKHLLEEVILPSSIGDRHIKYYYEDPDHPGVLTAIENTHGHRIQFEYAEDPTDNDERLNPRLKIKKIIDPEGITFEYEYDPINSKATVAISQNGNTERKVKFAYIRDINNTKKRYITSIETQIRRGYIADSVGNVTPRQSDNPQDIRNQTDYSKDGRFNVEKTIDPLNRTIRYQYNDFNQVEKVWDFDNHWTKYTYDIPENPSLANPRCYDILSVEKENILHAIDPTNGNIVERVMVVKEEFEYDKYDSDNSPDNADHGKQSTHRVSKETDERRRTWASAYHDPSSNNPLAPTLVESPLGSKAENTYNNRGERLTSTDSEGNTHRYEYYDQGTLKEYTDPNQGKITMTYYPCGNWLHQFKDQLGNVTEFTRESDGRIRRIMDSVQDSVDYEYQKNDRLHKITNHRPAVPQDSTNPGYLITGFPNLETEFHYTSLGRIDYLKNPKGLELLFEYDEAGRMFQWHHNVIDSRFTKFIYDAAGQLKQVIDRKGKSTVYTYYDSGSVKTVKYPDWHDGTKDIPGKLVKYKEYDYLGRLFSVEESEILGAKEFVYDEAGNIILRRDPDGFEISFAYDGDNRLWYSKDSTGMYELTLELDGLDRPRSLRDSTALDGSLVWEYKYKKQVDSVTKVLNLFEKSLSKIGLVSSFDYSEKNLLKLIEHEWSGSPPTLIYTQVLNYRDDGLVESVTGADADSFNYDGIKQLIHESVGNLSSDYDEAGNRLYRTDRTATSNPPANVYGEANQLKIEKGTPVEFTYDENGNTLASNYPFNPTEFYFDGMNRLRLIKNSQFEIAYLYDYKGKLIEREVKTISNGSIENTHFSYLLSKPILIKRNGNPFMLLTWDANGGLLRVRKYQFVGSGNLPNSLFPLHNGFGDLVRFADSAQNILVEVSYDAWGNFLKLDDSNNHFEFFGYRNGMLDRLSATVLFGLRWYFPKIGRWISEDPSVPSVQLNHWDLSNLYAYARNNPINLKDRSGLAAKPEEVASKSESLELPHPKFSLQPQWYGMPRMESYSGKPLYNISESQITSPQQELEWWLTEGIMIRTNWFASLAYSIALVKGTPEEERDYYVALAYQASGIIAAGRRSQRIEIQPSQRYMPATLMPPAPTYRATIYRPAQYPPEQ